MKKVIVGLLTFCILLTTPGMVSHAANTSDKDISMILNSATGTFKSTKAYEKYNSTKVYVYVTSAPMSFQLVQTWGDRGSGTYKNETSKTTATIRKGVQSSITNFCYEHKTGGISYVMTKLKIKSGSVQTGLIGGVWSPDSTRNYTVVN